MHVFVMAMAHRYRNRYSDYSSVESSGSETEPTYPGYGASLNSSEASLNSVKMSKNSVKSIVLIQVKSL